MKRLLLSGKLKEIWAVISLDNTRHKKVKEKAGKGIDNWGRVWYSKQAVSNSGPKLERVRSPAGRGAGKTLDSEGKK